MNEIILIENFLKKYQQDSIEDVLTHNEFPYFLYKVTVDNDNIFNTNVSKDTAQFVHIFSFDGNNSTFLNHVSPLYNKLIDLLDSEYFLVRCKANLNFQDESYLENHYYTPHIDNDDSSGISAIYYVNDSDVDTYFFNENKEIVKRVSPKKGTLVYWPNGIFHAGSPPKKSQDRVVINRNLRLIMPKYY